MDNKDLLDAINQVMLYGKYRGRQLLDLPEPYLEWCHCKGFPQGKLGTRVATHRQYPIGYSPKIQSCYYEDQVMSLVPVMPCKPAFV